MLIKKQINPNVFKIIFFVLIYLLGLNVFKDYGIYLDDEYQRENAFFWYNYIKNFLFDPSLSLNVHLENLIDGKIEVINSSTIPSLQPAALGIFSEIFIDLLDFSYDETQQVYFTRHLYNFTIFFIGLFFFYKLIMVRFKSHLYSFIGVSILFLTPRFFAESFYNSQDIYFLSLTIINMYTGINFLKKPTYSTTLLFALSSALAFDTRIMAILSISIFLFLFFLKSLRSNSFFKKNVKFFFFFVFYTIILVILFWPYLWTSPINNFVFALSQLSSAKFILSNFYLGKYVLSTLVPWHYHIVWIGITTPLIVILLFTTGIIYLIRRSSMRLVKVNDDLNDLWRGDNEMSDVYFFLMILLSIFIFINKGLGYTGWRHLYYIYPSIILIALYGFHHIYKICKSKSLRLITYLLIFLNFIYLSAWNYKYHPFQNVYFNPLFKKNFDKNFDMDYWALSNKKSLEYIVKNSNLDTTIIATKSFASIRDSALILSNMEKSKIISTQNISNADFVITNYMKRIRNDFIIDMTKYEKYFEILVDGKPINTVYKKNK